MDDVLDSIFDVWAGAEDIQEYGVDYVEYVIEEDVRRLDSVDDAEAEAVRALSDIAINAIRGIHELTGDNPKDHILHRLETRKEGDTERVVGEYVEGYLQSRE